MSEIHWADAIVGFVLGLVAAYIAHAWYDHRHAAAKLSALIKKYARLAGSYSNYRPDGNATGGSVSLTQESDGSFRITGLHADRTVNWESHLWMDEKYENHGIARYQERPSGHGVQFIRYIPENGEIHVKGVRESSGPPLEFHHIWRPKQV